MIPATTPFHLHSHTHRKTLVEELQDAERERGQSLLGIYIITCRLMRRRIKVADPRIFLIYAIYARKWSMNIIMNLQRYARIRYTRSPGLQVATARSSRYSVRSSRYTGIATAYGSYRHASSCARGCRHTH